MTTTPDLSELTALNSRNGRNRCTVPGVGDQLSDTDRVTYLAALDAPTDGPGHVEHAAIERWLRKRNIHIAAQTIGRHRGRRTGSGCGCPL